jgi:hypothetical protein
VEPKEGVLAFVLTKPYSNDFSSKRKETKNVGTHNVFLSTRLWVLDVELIRRPAGSFRSKGRRSE